MSDWPSYIGKKTSRSNFKLKFSERLLVTVRGFLFQFGVIWKVWWSGVIIYLEIGHLKSRNVALAGNDRKNDVQNNFKLRFSKRSLDLVKGFLFQFGVIWEVWLPVVIIQVKNGHCKTRNIRLAGQRQKNDVTQQIQTKIFYEIFGSSRGFLFQFGVIWEVWLQVVIT